MLGRSDPMTPEKAEQILALRAKGFTQHKIAAALNLNQGRVSEVCCGKSFPDAQPASDTQLPLL